jgi:hypothetical protein
VGKRYLIFEDEGKVFATSPVTKVTETHIHTKSSVYRIEVLGDEDVPA